MDQRIAVRHVRTAAALFCFVLTVLLFALWVRSYWRCDMASHLGKQDLVTTLGSHGGTFYFVQMTIPQTPPRFPGWALVTLRDFPPSFQWRRSPDETSFRIPYMLPAITAAVCGAVLLPKWKMGFSLRTVFITTTLVAAVLGLGAWLVR